jgi:LCP family protein required for cell wall assembly
MPRKSEDQFDIHRTLPNRKAKARSSSVDDSSLEDLDDIKGDDKKRLGFNFKRALVSIVIIVFSFFLIIACWDLVELSKASKNMFGSGNLFSLLLGDSLQTDDSGRVNILVAGYSADDPGHQGANLTDSIMLVSLNQKTKTGYMLSIPRDLWVDIPDYGHAKINEAYQDGQSESFTESGYPSGGMGLLEKVVAENFGVKVNYYALIGYSAFRDMVDAVGGITINIQSSDPRGIYDPSTDYTSKTCCALADYPNGPATLNGKQALDLARARGDSYGSYGFSQADFDRTAHQREMLLAVKQKAVSPKNIFNPTKAGHLFDGVANNIKTDIDIGSALPLYKLFGAVNGSSLKSESLRSLNGKNYLTDYGGALIPLSGVDDFSQIQSAIDNLNAQ